MLRPYLLVFNPVGADRQNVLEFLDTRPEAKNWYAFLPTAIVVISDCSAIELSVMLRTRYPDLYHIFTEITSAHQGWLPEPVWTFINNPTSTGRWP